MRADDAEQRRALQKDALRAAQANKTALEHKLKMWANLLLFVARNQATHDLATATADVARTASQAAAPMDTDDAETLDAMFGLLGANETPAETKDEDDELEALFGV